MNQYGNSTRLEVAEFYEPVLSWDLNQQPRSEQYEEHHGHEYRSPIRHLLPLVLSPLLRPSTLLFTDSLRSLLKSTISGNGVGKNHDYKGEMLLSEEGTRA